MNEKDLTTEMKKILQETTFKLTVRNFSFQLGADIIKRILSAAIAILLANYLGVAENGRYNLVFSFLFMVLVISEFGLGPIVMRDFSRNRSKYGKMDHADIVVNAIALKLICSLIAFGIGATVLFHIVSMAYVRELTLLAMFTVFFNWRNVLLSVFESQLELKTPSIIQIMTGLCENIVMLILILMKSSIWTFIFWKTIVFIPETLLFLKYLQPLQLHLSRVKLTMMGYLIKQSFPLFLSSFCIVIYLRVDQLFLNAFFGKAEVGIYAAAVNLSQPFSVFALAFMSAMAPMITRFLDQPNRFERLYHDSFRLMNSVAIPLAVMGTLLSEHLIGILYHVGYSEASLPFSILLWGNVFVFMGIVNNKLLIITHKQSLDLLFTFVSLIVNLVLNFFLIPRYGIEGAAIASLLAYATGPILGYFIPASHPYSEKMFITSIRPAIASLMMGLVVYPLRHHVISAFVLGGIVYILILRLVRGIHAQDWELLKSLRFNERFRF